MTVQASGRRRAITDVGLVYRREIRARLSSRGYFVGMAITVLAVFGLIVGLSLANAPKIATVAVCGASPADFGASSTRVRLHSCADLAAARVAVTAKTADAAVAVQDGQVTVLVRRDSAAGAQEAAMALGRNEATAKAYREQGVDVARLAQAVAQGGPHLETLGAGASGDISVVLSILIILFMQIIGQGSVIAQGVVEEKSTRIIEVLLATLTPLRLMVGKVAGIGTAALFQVLALVGAVLGASAVVSDRAMALPDAAILASAGSWFLLTFALFAALFAAAGSLVSRAEDLQSVIAPLLVIALAPVGVAAAAARSLDTSWVHVLQYVPPFSGLLMPLQTSVGGVTVNQQLAAAALMLVATAGCMAYASRVYQSSILKIGSVVRWRRALAA